MDKGMYVRCPADYENSIDPRIFITGKIVKVDEISKSLSVIFEDPYKARDFYEMFPKEGIYSFDQIERCMAFRGSKVKYCKEDYEVLESSRDTQGWVYYYLQSYASGKTELIREDRISIPFTNGRINPLNQLQKYEFQNPKWYFGRNIVARTMSTIDNSMYGFKELAGCKIFLKPYQLKSVMRCLHNENCRYMLADEVGLGKTIEACSIIKIYLNHKSNKKVLIAVPESLVEQWKVELFVKFNIIEGNNYGNNFVKLIDIDKVELDDVGYDFVIVDEAHRLLQNNKNYRIIYTISKSVNNILFLSATPVQQQKNEYLKLLRLIAPQKYDDTSGIEFDEILKKQQEINSQAYLVLKGLDSYQHIIADLEEEGLSTGEIREDEEFCDRYEEIMEGLEDLQDVIENELFDEFVEKIKVDDEDYGQRNMQIALSYLCENYQIEKNIIRNRRLFMDDFAERKCEEISYALDIEMNSAETKTYEKIFSWIEQEDFTRDEFVSRIIPLLAAFYSSPWAFLEYAEGKNIPEEILEEAEQWRAEEDSLLVKVDITLEDPDAYNNRIIKIIDYIDQELADKKIVIFTNYRATFKKYQKCFSQYFGKETCAFFEAGMNRDDMELNVYRFQKTKECRIMLCDKTGGEGRNFQEADYVVHIDLPWDANAIEQRIGRLDRVGRDVEKDVVSVVIHTVDTIEEQLFKFWNEGLNVFQKSLSGLEIIMSDINESIISAITDNFKYGLENEIDRIIEKSKQLELEVQKEQYYDTAAYRYNDLNKELENIIRRYNRSENEWFSKTLMNWAHMAGFNASSGKVENVISFNEKSFSPGSAIKALLIPPKWEEYMNKTHNEYVNHILDMYEEKYGEWKNSRKNSLRKIEGTFTRSISIQNDMLHFFAPGDDVFDCLVDNALRSCKGQCTAFAFPSSIEWIGLVYTWSFRANEKIIFEKGLSPVILSQYRNFISYDSINTYFPMPDSDDVDISKVSEEFSIVIENGYDVKRYAHLGKRHKGGDIISNREKSGICNLEYIKQRYPEELWKQSVQEGYQTSKSEAVKKFISNSNLSGLRVELEKMVATKIATDLYYGVSDHSSEYEELKEIIMNSLKQPLINLESVCLVWMVNINEKYIS